MTNAARYDATYNGAELTVALNRLDVVSRCRCIVEACDVYLCGALPMHVLSDDGLVIRWTITLWRRGLVVSGVRRVDEVNPRRARLVQYSDG